MSNCNEIQILLNANENCDNNNIASIINKKEILVKYRNKCKEQMFSGMVNLINQHLTTLETILDEICEHQFVEDDIDITPDNSIKIKYCEICEKTI